MKTSALSLTALLLTLVYVCSSPAQWQWAGGVPVSSFSTIVSTGNFITVSPYFAGYNGAYSTDAGESWELCDLFGFMASSMVLAKTAADTVLLAVAQGNQVWMSSNGGKSWALRDSGLGQASVKALAFSRGTGALSQGVAMAASSASGIFVSLDLGNHWTPSTSGLNGANITAVTAIDSTFLVGTGNRGVFRSTDNGSTWLPASVGIPDSSIDALSALAGWTFAASGNRIYRSSDRGGTWMRASANLSAPIANIVLQFFYAAKRSEVIVYAVTSGGCFRLFDSDTNWTQVRAPASGVFSGSIPFTITAVGNMLYTVDRGQISCSSDRGSDWFQVGNGIGNDAQVGHISSRSEIEHLYWGWFVSTNHGSNWISTRQGDSVKIHTFSFSVSHDTNALGYDQLTVGTDSGSVEFSSDGGRTWQSLGKPVPDSHEYMCRDVAELDDVIYASLQRIDRVGRVGDTVSGVYRTSNRGLTWERAAIPNTANGLSFYVTNLDVFRARFGGRVLYAGTPSYLFRSTDDGKSWWENTTTPVRRGVTFIRQLNQMLYLATGGYVYPQYSDDGSVTYDIDSAAVYRSTDDGLTWTDVSGNLHSLYIGGLAAFNSPQNSARTYLAVSTFRMSGYYTGNVKVSTDGGDNWRPFTDGLQPDWDAGMGSRMSADQLYIYCDSWRRPWSDVELTAVNAESTNGPSAFSLSQNYPNPFNPSTTIRYGLAHRSHVRLAIFNMLGQMVAELVNGDVDAGTHEVQFNATQLASGVYFYRLQAGGNVASRSMIVLK